MTSAAHSRSEPSAVSRPGHEIVVGRRGGVPFRQAAPASDTLEALDRMSRSTRLRPTTDVPAQAQLGVHAA
jgi:hypothetical protein